MKSLQATAAILVFAACGGKGAVETPESQFVRGPAIENELVSFFEDVGKVEITPEFRARLQTNSNLLMGSGSVSGHDGSERGYKWAMVTDDSGRLLGDFAGGIGSGNVVKPNLSEGVTRDTLKRCAETYPDAQDMFDCFDRVINKVIDDCDQSFTEEDCREHCWFQGGECFER